MNTQKLNAFLFAMLTAFSAGLSANAYGDDTEIYLGNNTLSSTLVKPNILFILDSSGSMSTTVQGTGLSRMDNLKLAVNSILDNTANVNVGLMRFTNVGGPVLYPISDLDAANSSVEGGGSSLSSDTSTVAASPDDATEDQVTHTVTTKDNALVLGKLFVCNFGCTSKTTTFVTSSSSGGQSDSADEVMSSGATYAPGYMYWRPSTPGPQLVDGVRFPNITIAPGARIANAVIDWTARGSDAGDLTATINGEARDNAARFTGGSNNYDVSHRLENPPTVSTLGPPTTNSVEWPVPDFSYYAVATTPDLSSIVQEIVCRGAAASIGCPAAGPGTWASGNAMAFILQFDGSSLRRTFNADAGSAAPKLKVTYVTGETPSNPSITGLRFQGLAIPQGVTITGASLSFTASTTSNDGATANFPSYKITAEKVTDATTFTAGTANSNISGRTQTAASVTWDSSTGLTDWSSGKSYSTPDLSAVIQELVNQGGWCGNNSINIVITTTSSNNARRSAYSFDNAPGNAPTLSVNWDPNSIPAAPGGCVKSSVVKQIAASTDDAQQSISTGSEATSGSSVQVSSGFMSGLRFQQMPIQQGATILSATVTMTASQSSSSSNTFTWKGEAADESSTFTGQANDISNRITTTASVTGNQSNWSFNNQYPSSDVSSIIQEIVGRPGWVPGNDLSLIVKGGNSNIKSIRSFDGSPAKSAMLSVTWKSYGNAKPYVKSVRQRLKEIVNDLVASGYTPTVSTMFEASQYLRGRDVVWGRYRSYITSEKPKTRVSHPASYTGGTDVLPSGCTSLNLSATACGGEYISGNPVYKSPISSNASCAGNYVVLVSDGYANANSTGLSLIDNNNTNFPGIGQCAHSGPDSTGVVHSYSQGEYCGRELAKWLHDNDLNSTLSGDQTVNKFFSVGFNLCSANTIHPVSGPPICCLVTTDTDADGNPSCCGTDANGDPACPGLPGTGNVVADNAAQTFLKDVSREGSGGQLNYTDASTASDLEQYFTATLAQILAQPATFAAPALSSNSFNKLFNRNDIYFAPFQAQKSVRWPGNVKKFKVCDGIQFTSCSFGQVLDKDGVLATDANGAILPTAQGVWAQPAAGADGIKVDQGGAAAMEPAAANRKVYTYTGTWPVGSSQTSLNNAQNAVSQANITALTPLLGNPSNPSMVINWILGYDVMDENANGNTSENRFIFADPLHSSPAVVQFGGQDFSGGIPTDDCSLAGPVEKLFIGTNDGELHMLNSCTGTEEWAWIPKELLPQQPTLMQNANGTHLYGLDLTPVVDVHDTNSDGIITQSQGDYVHVYIGMRDGGNNFYALDVTPSMPVSNVRGDSGNGQVQPKLLWEILGGTNTTQGDFSHLGKTWSTPAVTKIRMLDSGGNSVVQRVLIFGGGNDNALDYQWGPTPTNTGNIIYIVDALTGDLITSIGGTKDASNNYDAKLSVPGMKYPVPGGIGLLDSNGDGTTDRLYFGDLGGNVWRVDLNSNLQATSTGSAVGVVGQTADLAAANGAVAGPLTAVTRSFYNGPALVEVHDTNFSNQSNYDLILIGSGSRPHPLDTAVHNQFYALRDFNLDPLVDDGTGQGHAKSCVFNPSTQACEIGGVAAPDAYPTLTTTGSDLVNLTTDQLQGVDTSGCSSQSSTAACTTLQQLRNSAGWYLDLRENPASPEVATDYIGEKSLADASVIQGKLFFTTYTPTLTTAQVNECKLSEGDSRTYGIDMLTSAALFSDWTNPDSTSPATIDTRSMKIQSGGIPSAVVPYFGAAGSGAASGTVGQVSLGIGVSGGFQVWNPGVSINVNRTYWYEQR